MPIINKEDLFQLTKKGLNDSEIGKILGVSSSWIGIKRKSLNIPAARDIYRKEMLENVEKLSKQGLSDAKIGKILGKNYRTISHYRQKINLPPSMIELEYKSQYDRIRGYIIRNSKFMAKRRNITFDLKFTDFELPKYCPILNIPIIYWKNDTVNNSSHYSLDRIDNSKGYIKGNVIVISRLANQMKNCASFDELETFSRNILKITNYFKTQGALGSITDIFPDIELYQEN